MKLRWKVFLGTVIFFAICAAALPFRHIYGKRAVEAYKRELVARGEKLTIGELVPIKTTNGNERAREFLEKARPFSMFERLWFPTPMRIVAPGLAQVSWRSDEIFDGEKRTNSWGLLQKDVETNAQATAALRGAIQSGAMVFPVDNTQVMRGGLPHLGPLRLAATWLATATLFQLREGNKTEAAENLKSILRSMENYKGEPSMMSQFVRATCVQIAFNTTWEALQYSEWSDRELEEIQKAWSTVKFESAEEFFAIELANGIQMFEEARKSAEFAAAISSRGNSVSLMDDLTDFATDVTTDPGAAFKALMNRPNQKLWRWVLSYEEELFAMKLWHSGLEAARRMEHQGYYLPSLKKLDATLDAMGSRQGFLLGDTGTMARNTLVRIGSARIARQLAITGCILNRSKLQTGRYPKTLTELVPQFFPAIPRDPVDGAPIRYRLNTDGSFLLYSIGENGIDEGGDAERDTLRKDGYSTGGQSRRMRWSVLSRGRDWVWPRPATEAEILKWEDEEIKRPR